MRIDRKKLQRLAITTGTILSGITASDTVIPANALTFTFTPDTTNMPNNILASEVTAGFTQAGERWSALFNDNVNVNITIDFKDLGTNILGSTDSSRFITAYTNVSTALNADAKSANDFTAVTNLPKTSGFDILINQTLNSPTPTTPATPYLDRYAGNPSNQPDFNNSYINLSTANAKALNLPTTLNLIANSASDGAISFSNTFPWDFNPNNGIDANAYDFVGVATHEIGHVLGFTSGVDVLDFYKTKFNDYNYVNVNTLDLFRYSALSKDDRAIDWTADARDKYFSLDGGVTSIAAFSTGVTLGDGRQTSHWKDGLGLGIMGPTFSLGDLRQITPLDVQGFDVIGWDRGATVTVPEPTNFLGTFICATFGISALINRKQKLMETTDREHITKI